MALFLEASQTTKINIPFKRVVFLKHINICCVNCINNCLHLLAGNRAIGNRVSYHLKNL